MSDLVHRLRLIVAEPEAWCKTDVEYVEDAADEIERLTAERDEARRIACAYVSGVYRKNMITLDRAACLAEAERRGWDCFKDKADCK